jgi:hypothetical protein
MTQGHGERLSRKQEQAVAALLEHATIRAAAAAVPVHERTLRQWMRAPAFAAAYRRARRELLDAAVGRIQAATATAVDTLLAVAKDGAKDGDRVRAAVALLEHAFRGVEQADVLHCNSTAAAAAEDPPEGAIAGTAGAVVKLLAQRLQQVDAAELPTSEKSRLTATLADALLRAIGVDVVDKRLEALQAVLMNRKGKGQP